MEESIGDIRNVKKAKNNFVIAHNPNVVSSSSGSAIRVIKEFKVPCFFIFAKDGGKTAEFFGNTCQNKKCVI